MALLGFQVKFRKCTNLSSELGSIWKHSSAEVDCNSKLYIASTKCQNRTKDMRGFCSELARCLNMGARNRQKKLNTCVQMGVSNFHGGTPSSLDGLFQGKSIYKCFFFLGYPHDWEPPFMKTTIYGNPHGKPPNLQFQSDGFAGPHGPH